MSWSGMGNVGGHGEGFPYRVYLVSHFIVVFVRRDILAFSEELVRTTTGTFLAGAGFLAFTVSWSRQKNNAIGPDLSQDRRTSSFSIIHCI